MERIITDIKPEMVHSHNLYGFSPAVWRVAARQGLPVVHTAHDCYLLSPTGNLLYGWEESGFALRAFRAIYRRWYLPRTRYIDVFCSPSRHHLDLHRRIGCRAGDYQVIRNGVEQVGAGNGERGTLNKTEATREAPLRVLFMGRLESHKGIPVLLDAAELLAGVPIRLSIAGAGTFEADVRRAADRLPCVEYAGFVGGPQRHSLFRQSDLLVFPSVCLESFGAVVLEALACGVPVAVTDIGGPAELVENGVNGFKIPPNEPRALAELLKGLSAAPQRVRSMRANARASAADATVERMTDAYLKVYETARG